MTKRPSLLIFVTLLCGVVAVSRRGHGQEAGQAEIVDTSRGDAMIAAYFAEETRRLADDCLTGAASLDDWKARRPQLHKQLLEMLGLDPLPEKTDLNVVVTGETEHEQFVVRRLHFQSRPGLYVTGNLYVPKNVDQPLPAVLYVCGHGQVKIDGVSYGNKTNYQHHGGWFARNGYVCLTIDTIQLGEIEGIHHGTYRENMWWWLNRGYTPAGVEAWNCVRAIDYLQSLDEVDPERIGVTGRSGGGAYSWWIAAIDERVQCAVPVAGITDLENHVIDGCVEGHCDCMYMVNTYQWDYPMLAALMAPRPLLISNSDRDPIFPLDGVYRTHAKVKRIYELYDAEENLALNITAGGHEDTQELRVHAFRWLNHHLRGDDELIDQPAVKFFEPPQLKVLDEIPADQRTTTIHESFVAQQEPQLPSAIKEWEELKTEWRTTLDEKVFGGWPDEPGELNVELVEKSTQIGITFRKLHFTSQGAVRLEILLAHRAGLTQPSEILLQVLDDKGWRLPVVKLQIDAANPDSPESNRALAFVAPRGAGPTKWDQSEQKQIQHRRRFYLLGQTLDGQQVYDVRRAIQALRQVEGFADAPLKLSGEGVMAGIALYAGLYEPNVAQVELTDLAASHRNGPFLLNVTRFFDLPQTVAMVAEQSRVVLRGVDADDWSYAVDVAGLIGGQTQGIEFAE